MLPGSKLKWDVHKKLNPPPSHPPPPPVQRETHGDRVLVFRCLPKVTGERPERCSLAVLYTNLSSCLFSLPIVVKILATALFYCMATVEGLQVISTINQWQRFFESGSSSFAFFLSSLPLLSFERERLVGKRRTWYWNARRGQQ